MIAEVNDNLISINIKDEPILNSKQEITRKSIDLPERSKIKIAPIEKFLMRNPMTPSKSIEMN
jgi:hypothetical protein